MSQVEGEIAGLFEQYFYTKKGTITAETPVESIIKDSMDFIELIALITTKYGVTVNPEDIMKIRTIADIAKLVESSLKAKEDRLSGF